jgi:hypothetical protein
VVYVTCLKGLLAELELHTLRARLTAGLLNKAQRGDPALPLPAGLIRQPSGQVVQDPDQEVQSRLHLVFATFLRLKAASQVVRFLHRQGLPLPRRDRFGDCVWRSATTGAVLAILKNPAYAGACVFGRTRTTRAAGADHRPALKRLPLAEWKVCLRDRYPAYIDWATFEGIQTMFSDNRNDYERNAARGRPRRGQALLHGLVCCGECGHQMFVKYKNGVCYICSSLRHQYQAPVCQKLPAGPLDTHVAAAFLEALTAAELDVYDRAMAELGRQQEQGDQAHRQHLERLRYQAQLAFRQYDHADPDNRLVTAELERRWETALRDLRQAETEWASRPPPPVLIPLPPPLREALERAGRRLPELWHQQLLSPEHKKSFLRCLIDKVVAQRTAPDVIRVRIVWKGGDTTTAEVPVTVNALARLSRAPHLEEQALELARQGMPDKDIAALLTSQGYRSPRGHVVLPSTIRLIRLRHRVFTRPSQSHPRRIPGYLTVPQVACQLQTTADWVYHRINTGVIEVALDPERHLYLFPDRPETLTLFRQLQSGRLQKLRF